MKDQQPKHQQEFIDAVKKSAATQAYFCSDRDLNPDLGPESFFHEREGKLEFISFREDRLYEERRALEQDPKEIVEVYASAINILEKEQGVLSIIDAIYEAYDRSDVEKHVGTDACYILSSYLGCDTLEEWEKHVWSGSKEEIIKVIRHAAEITK